jgi:hypothetical protein
VSARYVVEFPRDPQRQPSLEEQLVSLKLKFIVPDSCKATPEALREIMLANEFSSEIPGAFYG